MFAIAIAIESIFVIAIERKYIILIIVGYSSSVGDGVIYQGRNFFNIGIFRKNASKYAKLMIEPYFGINLN